MRIEHVTLAIKGMTCINCEKILHSALKRLHGVKTVQVSYTKGTAEIRYDADQVSIKSIHDAIRFSGYSVDLKKSGPRSALLQALVVLAILFLVAQILTRLGVFSIVPEIQAGMSLTMLFIVGIMTSIHCVAMCGGINLSAVSSKSRQSRTDAVLPDKNGPDRKANSAKRGLLYNSGRIVSYTMTGAIAGALGQLFSLSEQGKNVITIIAALIMILTGVHMLDLLPGIRKIRLPIPTFLVQLQVRFSKGAPFVIGLFNGLMPCGPLQTMQIYALGTGSILMGALSMFFFAVGTVPLMFGISFAAGMLSAKKSLVIKLVSACLVILLGLQMMGRVVDIPMLLQARQSSSTSEMIGTSAVLEGDYQLVETRFTNGKYQPIIVQAGIPVKWRIIAEKGDLNGCNRSILIDEFQISKDLEYGVTMVEFLPEKEGRIRYTCWMNMITSTITVVDDISLVSAQNG